VLVNKSLIDIFIIFTFGKDSLDPITNSDIIDGLIKPSGKIFVKIFQFKSLIQKSDLHLLTF